MRLLRLRQHQHTIQRELYQSSMHFYSNLRTTSNRNIFTTAAALASAYYAVGLGRSTACDGPPSSPQSPPVAKFSNTRPRASNVSDRAATIPVTPPPLVGNRVYTTSVVAFKGQRSYMEDDFYVSKDGSFAAVYDGHGGAAVSKYLRQNLHAQVYAELPDEDASKVTDEMLIKALTNSFKVVDDGVMKVRHWSYMGSTAVVVVLHCNQEDNKVHLISANVGDSRAVLSRKGNAVELTQDHKPNLPSELERVKKLGGNVRWYGLLEQDGQPMEGMGVWRINGNLAVARAIGDRSERPFVSAEVDIKKFTLEEGDQFVILASDGLWDVMTSEEAVSFVHTVMSAQIGAMVEGGGDGMSDSMSDRPVEMNMNDWSEKYPDDRGIIRAAMMARKKKMARYLSEEAFRRGTMDNVTVIVIWLR